VNISWSEISNEEIFEFLKINFECGVLCSVDSLGFEIVAIIGSYLPTIQRTANITLINIYNNIYAISTGFSTSLTTLVANRIGEENFEKAENIARVGLGINFLMNIIISLTCIFFHNYIAALYLSDLNVLNITSNLIRIVGIFIIFDGMQLQISGILRGIGKQYQAMIIGIIIFIFVQSSLAYYFAFPLGMKIWGIWTGLLISTSFGFFIYFIYLQISLKEIRIEFDKLSFGEENIINDDSFLIEEYSEKDITIN